jgi:hypothetical protein
VVETAKILWLENNSYPKYRLVIRREVRNITTMAEFLQQSPGTAKYHQKRGHGESIPVGGVTKLF